MKDEKDWLLYIFTSSLDDKTGKTRKTVVNSWNNSAVF